MRGNRDLTSRATFAKARTSITLPVVLLTVLSACSGESEEQSGGAAGGTGPVATGGNPQTGGTATGGIATGGALTGGVATGGATTGGIATGGTPTGGVATGGIATGGVATGGIATGGAPTGGTPTGGAPTGGVATGGAETGGAETGGGAPGGAATGGAETGGNGTGGGDVVRSPGCGTTTSFSGESRNSIDVGGTNREYIVRLPDGYDSSNPYRLMVSIHCLNGTAAGVASGSAGANYEYYGLWSRDDDDTIFVAPQGINNSWPQGNEDFIGQLVQMLKEELCIDETRVFAEGFSMGGSMSYALACKFPDVFRAIAVHSGGAMSGCDQSNRGPVAYFMTHGINDSVCTYPNYGVPQLNDFAERNGCDPLTLPTPTDPSGNTPVCVDFQNCDPGYPTRACVFVGDHTPSPPNEANTWVPDETWDFISQF